jgi:uncharacterized protein
MMTANKQLLLYQQFKARSQQPKPAGELCDGLSQRQLHRCLWLNGAKCCIGMARDDQAHWGCISGCGACCRLDPSLRQEAIGALSPEQQEQYMAMVGADGWCINFNTGSRSCRIYAERPDFCNVANLVLLFGTIDDPSAGDRLAISCCLQQIRSEYGGRGRVMKRFQRAIRKRP